MVILLLNWRHRFFDRKLEASFRVDIITDLSIPTRVFISWSPFPHVLSFPHCMRVELRLTKSPDQDQQSALYLRRFPVLQIRFLFMLETHKINLSKNMRNHSCSLRHFHHIPGLPPAINWALHFFGADQWNVFICNCYLPTKNSP